MALTTRDSSVTPQLGRAKIDQEQEERIKLFKKPKAIHLLQSQVPVKNSPDAVKLCGFHKRVYIPLGKLLYSKFLILQTPLKSL